MCVNNLPKVVTWKQNGWDWNLWPLIRKSNDLNHYTVLQTTRHYKLRSRNWKREKAIKDLASSYSSVTLSDRDGPLLHFDSHPLDLVTSFCTHTHTYTHTQPHCKTRSRQQPSWRIPLCVHMQPQTDKQPENIMPLAQSIWQVEA